MSRSAGMLQRLGPVALVGRLSFRASPALAIAAVVMVPLTSAFGAATAIGFKLVADAVVQESTPSATRAALFLAATGAATWFASSLGALLRMTLTERVGHELQKYVATMAASIPGLGHLESPEFLDKLGLVNREGRALAFLGTTAVHALATVAQLALTTVILGFVYLPLALLPLTALPIVWATNRGQASKRGAEESQAESFRLAEELHWLTILGPSAKEIIAYGLGDEVRGRQRAASMRVVEARKRAEVLGSFFMGLAGLCTSAGYIGAVVLIAWRAANDAASPGDMLLAVVLAGQFSTLATQLFGHVSSLGDMLRTAGRVEWMDRYSRMIARPGEADVSTVLGLTDGIRVENVSYRYVNADQEAIKNVSLDIPAGSVVAFVGENGAGKTTLVKILCRLYDPTAGRILIDGRDLCSISHEAWSSRVSATFQDYARLQFTLRESVGAGMVASMGDDAVVEEALRSADGGALVASYENGLDTQLGSMWPGGREPSGGEWQKIALGRALMPRRPLLLVLDEPSASLDAATEHALYRRLVEASTQHTEAGGITLIVSHRLSSVAMADMIVFLENGQATEVGSHPELMARSGLYAELYQLQARGYSDAFSGSGESTAETTS